MMAAGVQMRATEGTRQYLQEKTVKIKHFISMIGRPNFKDKIN